MTASRDSQQDHSSSVLYWHCPTTGASFPSVKSGGCQVSCTSVRQSTASPSSCLNINGTLERLVGSLAAVSALWSPKAGSDLTTPIPLKDHTLQWASSTSVLAMQCELRPTITGTQRWGMPAVTPRASVPVQQSQGKALAPWASPVWLEQRQ